MVSPLFPEGSSSPAEVQVCTIAAMIGLDSERLVEVCQQMRKEYVVEAWQLPDLDSRQWEQLKAPIGLAVAVKHISTQRQFAPERELDKIVLQEEKEQEIPDVMCCDDSIFPTPSLPGWSLKAREEKQEAEVETKTVSEEPSLNTTTDQSIGHMDTQAASASTAIIENDAALKSDTVVEHQPFDENDDESKKTGFIEEYTEWFKQVIVPTTNDDEEAVSAKVESPSRKEATTLVPNTDSKSNDDDPAPMANDATEDQTSNEDQEQPHSEIKSSNESIGSEISATIEKEIQLDLGRSESFDSSMEEEFFNPPENVESDKQNLPQHDINSAESRESDSSMEPDFAKTINVENDDYEDKDATLLSIDNSKEHNEENIEMQESPDGNMSDSESDMNHNIFSGIPHSASFSEDDDDDVGERRIEEEKETEVEEEDDRAKKENSHEPIDSVPISSTDEEETSTLDLAENLSDDITVAHSNVSPEGKISASKRRKMARIYPHEYDRDASISFEVETASLQKILVELPMEDHRAILSQLLIMTNARDRVSRTNLAFQVQDSLVALIEKHQIDVDPAKAVQIVFHLSRLKKVYRAMFGKSLFKAMSKLYKTSEKTGKVKSTPKKKKVKRSKESPVQEDKNQGEKRTPEKGGETEPDRTDGGGVQPPI